MSIYFGGLKKVVLLYGASESEIPIRLRPTLQAQQVASRSMDDVTLGGIELFVIVNTTTLVFTWSLIVQF